MTTGGRRVVISELESGGRRPVVISEFLVCCFVLQSLVHVAIPTVRTSERSIGAHSQLHYLSRV
jgi:hypothetical protein